MRVIPMDVDAVCPRDTSLASMWVQLQALQRIGPIGRLQMAMELSDNVRAISQAGVRQRHPEYTQRQVELAAIRLALGDDLFRQAYKGLEVEP